MNIASMGMCTHGAIVTDWAGLGIAMENKQYLDVKTK